MLLSEKIFHITRDDANTLEYIFLSINDMITLLDEGIHTKSSTLNEDNIERVMSSFHDSGIICFYNINNIPIYCDKYLKNSYIKYKNDIEEKLIY